MGRTFCRRDRCVPLFEPLEPRLLLAGDLVLTEFLAVNSQTGPVDKDGAYSPWIEIRNTSGSPINLKNYYLTSNPDSLTTDPTHPARLEKWRFTSDFIINAGASRIVYASEKSTMTSTEAHTNFRLGVGDGYLALVQSDGVTVVSEFNDYPDQRQDCSYGRAAAAGVTLVASEAAACAWVPTDAAVEQAWYDPSFDDSAWAAGTTGVGFEYGSGYASLIHLNVGPEMYNQNGSVYIRIPFNVTEPEDFSALTLRMKYDDGFVAYLNGVAVASRNAPALLSWDSGATASHSDTQAKIFADIDISEYLSALRRGDNLLAIQGMNYTVSNKDLLFIPELVAPTADGWYSQFYAAPTPNAANGAAIPARYVADTTFSVDRGFFADPFSLVIACATPGAEIRYTLDGSLPTSTTGLVYADPISISRTAMVRAAAFKSGLIPTNVDTQTYIFPADIWLPDVLDQAAPAGYPATWSGLTADYDMDPEIVNSPTYQDRMLGAMTALPVLSIVLPLDDMFGASAGLYTHPTSENPVWQWERATSVELIYADGTEGFQVDAGIQIQGGASRTPSNSPKHSLRLVFKSGWGESKLRYPLFGDGAAGTFDTITLRAGYNNTWIHHNTIGGDQRGRAQYLHDQWMMAAQLAMGNPASHTMYVHLYINGIYWGLYTPTERPAEAFAASYLGGSPYDYDVLQGDGGLQVVNGDRTEWDALMAVVNNAALTPDQKYEGAKPYLDVDNFIDYMILNFYAGNSDWDHHNWYAIRNNATGEGFKFFSWDAERVLEGVTVDISELDNAGMPSHIHKSLRAAAEYRLRFADRLQKFFFNDGALTPAANIARYEALAAEIDQAIIAESARWGDYRRDVYPRGTPTPIPLYTRDAQWVAEKTRILTQYFPQRSDVLLRLQGGVPAGQFVNDGLYPGVVAPRFQDGSGNLRHGGEVPSGFLLTITAPAGDIWYTTDGTDPRLPGGGVNTDHAVLYTGPVTLAANTTVVKARVLSGSTWSALNEAVFVTQVAPPVCISELMYHPADPAAAPSPESAYGAEDFEYVELANTGSETLSLARMRLTGQVEFTFSDTATLAPGERLVVVANKAAFQTRYPTGQVPEAKIAGQYLGHLDNGNGGLRLLNALGDQVQTIEYEDNWYKHTDGQGFSLVAQDLAQAPATWTTKDGWRAGDLSGGAPAAADPGYNPNAVTINEVLAHTDASPVGDWIELKNNTGADIPVGGWYLSDSGAGNLTKYRIPAGMTVPANGYLILNQVEHFGSAFGLSEYGEGVYLTASPSVGVLGGYRESVTFGATERELTLGMVYKSTGGKDFTTMAADTKGGENAGPAIGPIVINEIMYHPPLGGDEYIELRNLTGADVPLYDPANPTHTWKFSDGILFAFPAGASVPANGYALVVAMVPADFGTKYGVPIEVPIYGPYLGALEDAGETLELSRPLEPEAGGYLYLRVDRVTFGDASPWPTSPDGEGPSLERLVPGDYGNDVANWLPGPGGGTPGSLNTPGPSLTLLKLNGRDGRGPGATDPSGLGVRTIEVTFSEAVTFASSDVTVQAVDFSGGEPRTLEAVVTPLGDAAMLITLPVGAAYDTWVKVALSGCGTLQNPMGRRLDGEARSGAFYIADVGLDLPSGDAVPGGDAVFYVGSLRGDMDLDRAITAADKAAFATAWRDQDLDADFRGVGFGVRPPDGRVTVADINGFTSAYQAGLAAGRRLDELPAAYGGGAAAGVTELPAPAAPVPGVDILVLAAGQTAAVAAFPSPPAATGAAAEATERVRARRGSGGVPRPPPSGWAGRSRGGLGAAPAGDAPPAVMRI